jgi:hypothetical protein
LDVDSGDLPVSVTIPEVNASGNLEIEVSCNLQVGIRLSTLRFSRSGTYRAVWSDTCPGVGLLAGHQSHPVTVVSSGIFVADFAEATLLSGIEASSLTVGAGGSLVVASDFDIIGTSFAINLTVKGDYDYTTPGVLRFSGAATRVGELPLPSIAVNDGGPGGSRDSNVILLVGADAAGWGNTFANVEAWTAAVNSFGPVSKANGTRYVLEAGTAPYGWGVYAVARASRTGTDNPYVAQDEDELSGPIVASIVIAVIVVVAVICMVLYYLRKKNKSVDSTSSSESTLIYSSDGV